MDMFCRLNTKSFMPLNSKPQHHVTATQPQQRMLLNPVNPACEAAALDSIRHHLLDEPAAQRVMSIGTKMHAMYTHARTLHRHRPAAGGAVEASEPQAKWT